MTTATNRLDRIATYLMIIASALLIVLITGTMLARTDDDEPPDGENRQATRRPTVAIPSEDIEFESSASRGSADAPVVVMVFSEFECPYCKRFATDVLPAIDSELISQGAIQLVFRHLPLPKHTNAFSAAEASECARRQGRFWEMHDALFGEIASPKKGSQTWGNIRLDQDAFARCMATDASEAVHRDLALARQLGITATPTFLVGKRVGLSKVKVLEVKAGLISVATLGEMANRLRTQ